MPISLSKFPFNAISFFLMLLWIRDLLPKASYTSLQHQKFRGDQTQICKMVRYKKRYALCFLTPSKISNDKLLHLLRVHMTDYFGIANAEFIQSLQIMYYHPITGTAIIRCRLQFINHLRVGLLYFHNCIIQHVSATMRQISRIFEMKMRHFIRCRAHEMDVNLLASSIHNVILDVEKLENAQ
eukprot:NODE_72_length_24857_cov_0.454399.p14 type:complete len:183 gc:universal NODE_72_length_24857_cov_0.454399:1761-1213(-)